MFVFFSFFLHFLGRNPLTAESIAINLPLDIAAFFRVPMLGYFALISFLSTQDSRSGLHASGRLLWRADSEMIAEFYVKKKMCTTRWTWLLLGSLLKIFKKLANTQNRGNRINRSLSRNYGGCLIQTISFCNANVYVSRSVCFYFEVMQVSRQHVCFVDQYENTQHLLSMFWRTTVIQYMYGAFVFD